MFNDAIVYDRYGPPSAVLTLKRLPLAPLAGGRVRVRMRYAPVNPSDLIPVTGAYRHRTRLPAVAGYEGLGEVVAAPYGSRLCAGQRVLPLRGGGTGSGLSIWMRPGWCRCRQWLTICWPHVGISIR